MWGGGICEGGGASTHKKVWACIATGPSLTKADCEAAREKADHIIAINDAWTIVPDADFLYACDGKWWQVHGDAVKAKFKGECWACWPDSDMPPEHKLSIDQFGLRYVRGSNHQARQGIVPGLDRVSFGGNSGHQAIHLARNWGATKIMLLGYDYGGKPGDHFFGEHKEQRLRTGQDFKAWLGSIEVLAKDLAAEGVQVINCTRQTAINCFPRSTIDACTFN